MNLQSTQQCGTEQPANFPAAHDICHAPLTHYPTPTPTPHEAFKSQLEPSGLSQHLSSPKLARCEGTSPLVPIKLLLSFLHLEIGLNTYSMENRGKAGHTKPRASSRTDYTAPSGLLSGPQAGCPSGERYGGSRAAGEPPRYGDSRMR